MIWISVENISVLLIVLELDILILGVRLCLRRKEKKEEFPKVNIL